MTNGKIYGIITKGIGGLYGVRLCPVESADAKTVLCRARGVFRHEKITPLPGDKVALLPVGEIDEKKNDGADYVIDEILERASSLIRPALANLTHLFAVIPAARPKPDLYTADKLICAAEGKGIEPVIIITKSDADPEEAERIRKIYEKGSFSVFVTDISGSGDEALLSYIEECSKDTLVTSAFAGASGAGKSTLMTRLFPDLGLKTGDISRKIERGRHTTRHAELYPITVKSRFCFIADTPGFSMMDFTRFNFIEAEDLPYTFREFDGLMGECRYTKCTHTKEEGCAVLEKMKNGNISPERHQSYCLMLEEIKKNPPWKRKE